VQSKLARELTDGGLDDYLIILRPAAADEPVALDSVPLEEPLYSTDHDSQRRRIELAFPALDWGDAEDLAACLAEDIEHLLAASDPVAASIVGRMGEVHEHMLGSVAP
jgi:hypothetical protein